MQTLLTWWQGREPRERQLLLVLGVLLGLMLVWLVVLRPLAAFREDAAGRHERLAATMPSVRAAAMAITAAGQAPARADGRAVRDVVAASASAAGLEFTSTQPEDGGGVLVSIAAVKPTFLFAWIAGLEQNEGVKADRVLVQRNDDSTVSAQIGFAGGAA